MSILNVLYVLIQNIYGDVCRNLEGFELTSDSFTQWHTVHMFFDLFFSWSLGFFFFSTKSYNLY